MSSGQKDSGGAKPADPRPDDPRQERLARALRDNLKKRKAQQRQRQAGEGRGDGPGDGDGGDDGPSGGA